MASFTESVQNFIEANSEWLGPNQDPAIAALLAAAAELDKDVQAAMLGQYGLIYRSLLKSAPVADSAVDPLEAALPPA